MNIVGRAATVIVTTLVASTLLATPAQAKTYKPKPKADAVTIVAGKSTKLNVLKNDKVKKKSKAKIKLVSKRPAGIGVINHGRKLTVKVAAGTKPGKYTFKYRVVDFKKRKAKAKVTVTVKAAPPAPKDTLVNWINRLPVVAEKRTGYNRKDWKHWISVYGNGCDTRKMVLIAEAVEAPSVDYLCRITGGKWKSYYDAVETTDPSKFDIDHLVPLAEAHDSGGYAWDKKRKEAFANDVAYAGSLVAVSASSNRSKGDKDPAEWLPSLGVCRYVTEWVSVKYRWGLAVDAREKAALLAQAKPCPQAKTNVTMPGKR